MPAHIRVRVNEIVIHGEFQGDLAAFRAALTEELQRKFGTWQFSAAVNQILEFTHIHAPEIAGLPQLSGQRAGAQIARSIFRGISTSTGDFLPSEESRQGANK